MELISIIIPIYKVEQYLAECMESVLGQSYTKLEIILVDDGSPDACPALCDEYAEKDKRVKVIHKKNGGLSDARNAGLEIATGEYIAFVDSDDVIHKDYVRLLYEAIKDANADISACDLMEFQDGTKTPNFTYEIEDVKCNQYLPEEALGELIRGTGFRAIACNKMYKQSMLSDEVFEVGRYHEDEFFTYRMIDKAKSLTFVGAKLYYYRQRNGSIMAGFSLKHLDSLDAYLDRIALFKNKYPTLYKRDKISFCIACVNFYCCAKNILEREELKKAKRKIKHNRNIVHFSTKELFQCSARELFFVVGSKYLSLFCALRTKNKGEAI